jgi:glycosyltransferase involved in cell wall biosynthesis
MSDNILFIGSGKSYHVEKWTRKLLEEGHNVTLFTIHKPVRQFHRELDIVHYESRVHYLFSFFKLKALINKLRVKVVYAHSAGKYGALLSILPKSISKILFIYGSDVYIRPKKSIFHKFVVYLVLLRASLILSSSNAMKNHVKDYFRFSRDIMVIPFGVNTVIFNNSGYRVSNQVKKIGIVKKLEYVYGIDLLIEAFSQLLKIQENQDLTLEIVGDGSLKDELKELVGKLKLENNIFFRAAIPNSKVPSILKDFDIFVVPSRSESFGVAAVEALSIGVPTIAANVGGLPEVLDYGRAGRLFNVDSSKSLLNAMCEMINDYDMRKKLSDAGLEHVHHNYDLHVNYNQFLGVHNEYS